MAKNKKDRNLTLMEFIDKYCLPENFKVDLIPLQHPETGEKIYLIGSMMDEQWYRKKPGQAGQDGQMWPLMQGLGFDIRNLQVHPDIKKELSWLKEAGMGTFSRESSITK